MRFRVVLCYNTTRSPARHLCYVLPGGGGSLSFGLGKRCGSQWADLVPLAKKEGDVAESVYKVIELVGTSSESWEKAAAAAVARASETLRDLRIAEVIELDMQIENGEVVTYRAKVKVSFKYAGSD